jgi:hypothetical protein
VKIRTPYELECRFDEDLAWRRKEITTLKLMVSSSRTHESTILIKAAIALFYSHWEGHVKHCALVYLQYLNFIAPSYQQMTDNFVQISLYEKFHDGFSLKKFPSQKSIFNYLTNIPNEKFSLNEKRVIDTESNLKYEVFFNILNQLGLNTSDFELKENFINSKLLKCRNAIAHGDRLSIEELKDTYTEIEDELLNMIVTYQNLIRNAVNSKSYLRAT